MKKSELKTILKPLIKECIKEVIFEDGTLSGIITEVAKGLQGTPQRSMAQESAPQKQTIQSSQPSQAVIEARKSLEMRQELAIIRAQNIDYENFENKLLEFQDGFGKNVISARNNFDKAIKHIDETIVKLEKVKQHLTTSDNQLRLANNKTQDLSIKRLTRGNPTMRAKFDELGSNNE